jgi:hypothetical protein
MDSGPGGPSRKLVDLCYHERILWNFPPGTPGETPSLASPGRLAGANRRDLTEPMALVASGFLAQGWWAAIERRWDGRSLGILVVLILNEMAEQAQLARADFRVNAEWMANLLDELPRPPMTFPNGLIRDLGLLAENE